MNNLKLFTLADVVHGEYKGFTVALLEQTGIYWLVDIGENREDFIDEMHLTNIRSIPTLNLITNREGYFA